MHIFVIVLFKYQIASPSSQFKVCELLPCSIEELEVIHLEMAEETCDIDGMTTTIIDHFYEEILTSTPTINYYSHKMLLMLEKIELFI